MNTKRIITIVLFILTLVIGGVVAYFGYKLATEDQAPDDTSAATCGNGNAGCTTCNDNNGGTTCSTCCGGGCSTLEQWTAGYYACVPTNNTSGCSIKTVSSAKDSFTLSGSCSGITIRKYSRSYSGTSTAWYPNCVTDASNGTKIAEEPASATTYTAYAQGKCIQIDADGDGIGIGVCRCEPAAAKKSCNTSCSANSDCASNYCYKTNGSTTGKCRNSKCTSETDCTCPTTTASCGDGVKNQTSEECDVGVACTDTTKTCNTSTCKCEDVPDQCGDTCEADSDCPTNTFCNGVEVSDERYPDHMCILSACVETGISCRSTGCQVIPNNLPSTAIINKDADWIIVGIMTLLAGGVLLKFDVLNISKKAFRDLIRTMQTGKFAYITAPVSTKAQDSLTNKKKAKFEDKIRTISDAPKK